MARDDDPQAMHALAAAFTRAARAALPIRSHITEVTLMDNEPGAWQVRARFPLGPDTAESS